MPTTPGPDGSDGLHDQLDPVTRNRLERVARRGELAGDTQEAAIVVMFAREALRQLRWTVVLLGALLILNLVSAALVEDPVIRWLYIAAAALAALVIAVFLLRKRPLLLRAELRNRELLEESAG